jgi:glycerol-3-phosphate dehydrogenase (NAD(P)+)
VTQRPFAVLGAGSWGTALAIQLARAGHPTLLWGRHADHVARMQQARCNAEYIPEVIFPEQLKPSADLAHCLAVAGDILVVVPSHAFRQTMHSIKPMLQQHHRLAWGTKGLEQDSRKLLHQIVQEEIGITVPTAAVSGPTFAHEVARGMPGAITVASKNSQFALDVATALHHGYFRTYTSDDIIGVEVGGAVKNVMAIAAGISDGLGFGINTRAALITRGLAEIMRLGVALGGKRDTFMGLSGLGDLVLTCSDDQSRNRRMGLALGKGKSIRQAKEEIGQVVEGVSTAKAIHNLAEDVKVIMPITEQVYRVLYEGMPPREAVQNLMDRPPKPELA